MALDGIFLSKIVAEIKTAVGCRVDKIQQPGREEIVLFLRGKGGHFKLYICPSANAARLHFVSKTPEMPDKPPMFCMLLRKHLSGAMLTDVTQLRTDRVVFLHFNATNEIGDKVKLTLCVEIMGKVSNIALIGEDGNIIDAIKRVDFATSSLRQILPRMKYVLPPSQGKLSLIESSVEQITQRIEEQANVYLSKAALNSIEGISPIVARELAFRVTGYDEYVGRLNEEQKSFLPEAVAGLKCSAQNADEIFMLLDGSKKPKDMSFVCPTHYDESFSVEKYSSPSVLLEHFYEQRDNLARLNSRTGEMRRKINSLCARAQRKLFNRKKELEETKDRDKFKLYGELITNNIYALQKGYGFYEVANYYDDMKVVKIPVDPALSPLENANKYYKNYHKAKTAAAMLERLIEDGENELNYLESVLDELERADGNAEIDLIRKELTDTGCLSPLSGKRKQKAAKELPPLEFLSSDGHKIFVGRNNLQNDKLSLKIAKSSDMWLHTQFFPGSHVIVCAIDGKVSDEAIEEAAVIAAYFSKARQSSHVAVDYTPAKFLKKPQGSKPGKVIYHEYYTITVDPNEETVNKLKV